jgi:hypothetical protein
MYGLPKLAAIIANDRLVNHLTEYGYAPHQTHSQPFHTHATRPITYASNTSATRTPQTLKSLYNITTEWEGELYCGLTLA